MTPSPDFNLRNTTEIFRMGQEIEKLKQKLKEQTTLVQRLQRQLTAVLRAGAGNVLMAEASVQMLTKLHLEGNLSIQCFASCMHSGSQPLSNYMTVFF